MKSKNEMRSVWATYLCIAGTALLLWITVQLLIQRAKYYWRLPFFRGLWLTLSERSGWSAMVLIFCCLCAIGVSVWMFATPGYGMTDYWETDNRLRRRRILKKVAAEENIDTLANICREAPLREVREAAGTRRDGLMRPLFEEVAAQRDIRAVDRIRIGSPYREVREAAEAKKEELMRAALASGDLAGIGNMIDHIIECSYMEKITGNGYPGRSRREIPAAHTGLLDQAQAVGALRRSPLSPGLSAQQALPVLRLPRRPA